MTSWRDLIKIHPAADVGTTAIQTTELEPDVPTTAVQATTAEPGDRVQRLIEKLKGLPDNRQTWVRERLEKPEEAITACGINNPS